MFGFLKGLFQSKNVHDEILVKMLDMIDLFHGIPKSDLYLLSKKFCLKKYATDEHVIEQGTYPGKIGIVQTGELNVIKEDGVGKVNLGKVTNGGIFGEMSYFNNTATMASLITSSESVIWEVPFKELDLFFSDYPKIKDFIYNVMKEREKSNEKKLLFI